MDAELKAKWAEALESGKYKQGDGNLIYRARRDERAFCCLGVLCDIAGTQWNEIDDAGTLDGIDVRDEKSSFLSKAALDKFGLDNRTQKMLAKMNDEGASFRQIASFIKANL